MMFCGKRGDRRDLPQQPKTHCLLDYTAAYPFVHCQSFP